MGKFIFTTPAPPYIMCLSWFMGKFFFLLSWLRHSRRKIPSLFFHIKGLGHSFNKQIYLFSLGKKFFVQTKNILSMQMDRALMFSGLDHFVRASKGKTFQCAWVRCFFHACVSKSTLYSFLNTLVCPSLLIPTLKWLIKLSTLDYKISVSVMKNIHLGLFHNSCGLRNI